MSAVHFATSYTDARPLCGAPGPAAPYVAPGVQATLYQCPVCAQLVRGWSPRR